MENDLLLRVRAAASIADLAGIEPASRDLVLPRLRGWLSQQDPEERRYLMKRALDRDLQPRDARDLVAAATEASAGGAGQFPPHPAARAQPAFDGESTPSTGKDECPSAPDVLKQGPKGLPLAEQGCINTSGVLGHTAQGRPKPTSTCSHQGGAAGRPAASQAKSAAGVEADVAEVEGGSAELESRSDCDFSEGAGANHRAAAPPAGPPDVCYVSVQIWRNRDFAKRRQAQWTAKLRWIERGGLGVTHEVFVGFSASARKAREVTRRHAAEGKISSSWAEEFARLTADLGADTRAGPMTRRLYGKDKPPGASSNARETFEGCYATLTLDAVRNEPQDLMMDFGAGPISLSKFHPAKCKARNAAQWIGLHDPDGLQAAKRDLADLHKHLAQDQRVQQHSPATALGELIALYVQPLTEELARQAAELESLRRELAELKGDACLPDEETARH